MSDIFDNIYNCRFTLENIYFLQTAQFFWLISYFLSFAPVLKLDMEHVKDVLNIEILTYLAWVVVRDTEMLDKNFPFSELTWFVVM